MAEAPEEPYCCQTMASRASTSSAEGNRRIASAPNDPSSTRDRVSHVLDAPLFEAGSKSGYPLITRQVNCKSPYLKKACSPVGKVLLHRSCRVPLSHSYRPERNNNGALYAMRRERR